MFRNRNPNDLAMNFELGKTSPEKTDSLPVQHAKISEQETQMREWGMDPETMDPDDRKQRNLRIIQSETPEESRWKNQF